MTRDCPACDRPLIRRKGEKVAAFAARTFCGRSCALKGRTRAKKPIEHGTYSGYQAHIRRGIPACEDCKTAHNTYKAERRRANPEARAAEQAKNRARNRAAWRLAAMHPQLFRALCVEEYQKLEAAS